MPSSEVDPNDDDVIVLGRCQFSQSVARASYVLGIRGVRAARLSTIIGAISSVTLAAGVRIGSLATRSCRLASRSSGGFSNRSEGVSDAEPLRPWDYYRCDCFYGNGDLAHRRGRPVVTCG